MIYTISVIRCRACLLLRLTKGLLLMSSSTSPVLILPLSFLPVSLFVLFVCFSTSMITLLFVAMLVFSMFLLSTSSGFFFVILNSSISFPPPCRLLLLEVGDFVMSLCSGGTIFWDWFEILRLFLSLDLFDFAEDSLSLFLTGLSPLVRSTMGAGESVVYLVSSRIGYVNGPVRRFVAGRRFILKASGPPRLPFPVGLTFVISVDWREMWKT